LPAGAKSSAFITIYPIFLLIAENRQF